MPATLTTAGYRYRSELAQDRKTSPRNFNVVLLDDDDCGTTT
jgi:hypothetical protein